MIKQVTLCALLLISFNATAEVSVILPVATTHIVHSGADDYNNDNYGIGLAYSAGKNEVGAVYINKDSNNNENIYFYAARNYKITSTLTASVSLMLPTGYEALAIVPVWSLQYKMIRVSTTYPLAKIIDQPADVLNVQIVMPFKF